jgi:adenosylcobinamide-phosphate synthase
MIDRKVLTGAYLLDCVAGDPEWLPHPVKIIGKAIECGEQVLRKPGQSPATELLAGGFLSLSLIAAAYLGTAKSIAWANRRSRWQGLALETMLGWTCLASRSLHDEAVAVLAALEEGDLVLTRQRLARIVGRDTQHLEEEEVSRAVIETLAESVSDGVIAPLIYLAAGGVPLAMAYKTINTLDSMIGHADERYFYFGKLAARLDDIANILPSRLTALGIVVSASVLESTTPKTALAIWLRDGMKHKSPNAGQPESAMAGALQVRLGGENFYGGVPINAPLLGSEFTAPATKKARQAVQIVAGVSLLGALVVLFLTGQRR